jgi:hypothetical protein
VFGREYHLIHYPPLHRGAHPAPSRSAPPGPSDSPARGPPQAELDLDQTPAFDLAAPDAAPEFEFDPSSPPQDWEL